MTGLLAFRDRYADEQSCIAALASVRWPECGGRRGYRLNARPRVFECAGWPPALGDRGHGDRTKTPLRKWFLAAYWLARDKRGVSAMSWNCARDRLADRP